MLYIFLALIFYTTALMFSAAASRAINSNIVSAIVNTASAILPLIVIFPILDRKILENGKFGIIMAILAGLSIAFFAMSINKSFQVSKVGLVSPIVFGGAIVLTAILSYFIFKEKLSPLHITGVAIVTTGLLVIVYSAVTGK